MQYYVNSHVLSVNLQITFASLTAKCVFIYVRNASNIAFNSFSLEKAPLLTLTCWT